MEFKLPGGFLATAYALCMASAPALAVNRCVDTKGRVTYQDAACSVATAERPVDTSDALSAKPVPSAIQTASGRTPQSVEGDAYSSASAAADRSSTARRLQSIRPGHPVRHGEHGQCRCVFEGLPRRTIQRALHRHACIRPVSKRGKAHTSFHQHAVAEPQDANGLTRSSVEALAAGPSTAI